MKRWLFRIALVMFVLAALAALGVQVVLHTDIPRRIVLDVLREESGLRIDAASLRTGWTGRTRIERMSVALPLERDPFLTVPELHVSHTSLIRLLLTRRLEIFAVEAHHPSAEIKPDGRGMWNVLEAAEIFERAQRSSDPAGPIRLPRIDIRSARFDVEAPDGRLVRYEPLEIIGVPDNALAWRFDVSVLPDVVLSGTIAPGATWAHSVEFDVDQIPKLIKPWLPELPEPLRIAGLWQGQVRDAALTGLLHLHELVAGNSQIRGETAATVRGTELTLQPVELLFIMAGAPVREARLVGGRIRTDGTELRLERVRALAPNIDAQVTGNFNRDEEAGQMRITWVGEEPEREIGHEGTLTAQFTLPRIGPMSATGRLTVDGRSPFGAWESELNLAAAGRLGQRVTGNAIASRLIWMDEQDEIDLSGAAVRLTSNWPIVTLASLTIPGAETRATGRIDAHKRDWQTSLDIRNWDPPRTGLTHVNLALAANGRATRVDEGNLTITTEQHTLAVNGRYLPEEELPLAATIDARTRLDAAEGHDLAAHLDARFDVVGTLEPLSLAIDGELGGSEMHYREMPLKPLNLPLRGMMRDDAITFETLDFTIAEGTWSGSGRFEFADHTLELSLSGNNASISRMIELAELPLTLAGRADVDASLTMPQFDLSRLEVDGEWSARDVAGDVARLPISPTPIVGRGRLTVRESVANLHDMTLTQGDGVLTGLARIDFAHKDRLVAELTAHQWRIEAGMSSNAQNDADDSSDHRSPRLRAIAAVAEGSASLDVHMTELTAAGDLDLGVKLVIGDEPLAHITVDGRIDGRNLHLEHFTADALDGQLDGAGTIVLDRGRWVDSSLDVDFSGVDLTQLAMYLPEPTTAAENGPATKLESETVTDAAPPHPLHGLRGVASGTLSLYRATDSRPPEPMHVELNVTVDDGAFDAMTFSSLSADIFVGPRRAILQQMRIAMADGTVDVWGRISRHGSEFSVHGNTTLDRLDLNQIVHALRLAEETTPGRVSGNLSVGGYLFTDQPRLFGQGRLNLSESDIVGLPGVAELYSALRLSFGTPEPTGVGTVAVRLEGNSLELAPLTYFNRGTDILARIRIQDIRLREHSPVFGIASGVARPLKDIDLPFTGRVDRILSALQTDAATVRISGTLAEPEINVVPLAEVTGALGRILTGETQ